MMNCCACDRKMVKQETVPVSFKCEQCETIVQTPEGFKEAMIWDNRFWTPDDIANEIRQLCEQSNGKLSLERTYRVTDLARYMAGWLNVYVKKGGEA